MEEVLTYMMIGIGSLVGVLLLYLTKEIYSTDSRFRRSHKE